MKHLALLLILLASPAAAWEFTETAICRLTHSEAATSVEVTFDPEASLYTLTITQSAPWPVAPVFQLRFDGPRPLIISTDRHQLSADGRDLTVTDNGFGNVLDGIQYNAQMTAFVGDEMVSLSTMTAADAVQAFRDCPSVPTS